MALLKVCGLTRRIDAEFVDKYADYAGFIIHSDVATPRLINPKEAADIINSLSRAKPVAVIKGLNLSQAVELASRIGFNILQYHGLVNIDEFMSRLSNVNIAPVIEYVDYSTTLSMVKDYLGLRNLEYVLIDAPKVGYRTFEHGLKVPLSEVKDIFKLGKVGIAGGIGPNNVKYVVSFRPYLIDVNSGVESKPGVKDWELIMDVVKVVKGEGTP